MTDLMPAAALILPNLSPEERAKAALAIARSAAESGDCLAAEVAQDECRRALDEASGASAEVIVSHPFTAAARDAEAETRRVGEVLADVCLLHSRARVVARRRARA